MKLSVLRYRRRRDRIEEFVKNEGRHQIIKNTENDKKSGFEDSGHVVLCKIEYVNTSLISFRRELCCGHLR